MDTRVSASDLQVRLAGRILRMISDGSAPRESHLRELDLAETFGVSRTPVRAALGYLEELGALEKQANKGFFVRIDGTTAQRMIANLPKTDDDIIKMHIAGDWFAGRVSSEMSEGEIRTRYKLGKMTASRVLFALCEEGIVSRAPGYGWRFEPTLNSREAHDESYDFRLVVEPAAILSPTFRLESMQSENLRNRHRRILEMSDPDLSETIHLDEDFHEFLARCSNNRFVVHAIQQQNKLRRLLEYQSLIDAGRLVASCQEHVAILDHIERGDMQTAADIMKRHLEKARAAAPDFGQGMIFKS